MVVFGIVQTLKGRCGWCIARGNSWTDKAEISLNVLWRRFTMHRRTQGRKHRSAEPKYSRRSVSTLSYYYYSSYYCGLGVHVSPLNCMDKTFWNLLIETFSEKVLKSFTGQKFSPIFIKFGTDDVQTKPYKSSLMDFRFSKAFIHHSQSKSLAKSPNREWTHISAMLWYIDRKLGRRTPFRGSAKSVPSFDHWEGGGGALQ